MKQSKPASRRHASYSSRINIRRYVAYGVGVASASFVIAVVVVAAAVAYTARGGERAMATSQEQLTSAVIAATALGGTVAEPLPPAAAVEPQAPQPVALAQLPQSAPRQEPPEVPVVHIEAASAIPAAIRSEAAPAASRPVTRRAIENVNITFYSCLGEGFCGNMYNGQRVHQGAAACSFDLPIGTSFTIAGDPTNRVYRCEDRGVLTATWVDIYWYDPADGWAWQRQVGRYGTIQIVDLPG